MPLHSRLFFTLALLICGAAPAHSFTIPSAVSQSSPVQRRTATTSLQAEPVGSENSAVDSFVESIKRSVRIIQDSQAEKADFKQIVANVLAGDYDSASTRKKVEELVASAPCVVFTWEASPFSQKALKYLDIAGAEVKNVRLDDPWDEGNPLRAELGKMVGRTSVPCVWIGGEYVGGFDGGVSEEKPGILELAFK
eukprot:12728460-Ditylum_brightwellii.AAC.1